MISKFPSKLFYVLGNFDAIVKETRNVGNCRKNGWEHSAVKKENRPTSLSLLFSVQETVASLYYCYICYIYKYVYNVNIIQHGRKYSSSLYTALYIYIKHTVKKNNSPNYWSIKNI